MDLQAFLDKLNSSPDAIEFTDTMSIIESLYDFKETKFKNGDVLNGVGENSGSCKLFAFAQLQQLSEPQTLACFGAYYRNDVLGNPGGSDHQNIRNFMQSGWAGIEFDGRALSAK